MNVRRCECDIIDSLINKIAIIQTCGAVPRPTHRPLDTRMLRSYSMIIGAVRSKYIAHEQVRADCPAVPNFQTAFVVSVK